MKIGILGNGAREVAMHLALCNEENRILAAGTKINPQISSLAQWNVAVNSTQQIVSLMEEWRSEIILIGPESYLTAIDVNKKLSLADMLEQEGIKVVAPSCLPSQIELDKVWMIKLLNKYGMKNLLPKSSIFSGARKTSHVNGLINRWKEVVIKPAGLTGGKGVKIYQSRNLADAKEYAGELLQGGQTVIAQQKLSGSEFSLQAFVDRNGHIIFAPLVQDFKKLYDGDVTSNPNTGSMGSINNADGLLPFVDETTLENAKEAMRNIVAAIIKETGKPYKGPIYGQFMVTPDGLAIIEVNARLGDPEAINILSLLPEGKFTEICQGIVNGNLNKIEVNFRERACVVKYVVPIGYPGNSKSVVIKMKRTSLPVKLYCGGVIENNNGDLVTTGSRAIAVMAEGNNIPEAANIVNEAIPKIFANCIRQLHWRPGIGLEQ
ncbi:phosphoribosylamine--glycine ligase [Candidatus Parcubacteria bacterium]|nr:phosphoribosylamine--glycine ligase [Candidatus Parcubacteria bacterium]